MTRALLALFIGCGGLMSTLFASGITAKNHALAEGLHKRERQATMRDAAIEELFIRARGRVVGDADKSNVQNERAVSGSLNLGGNRPLSSDVSTTTDGEGPSL